MKKENEDEARIYRIFQCSRCTQFLWDYKGARMGWCKASKDKRPVIEIPKYDLSNSAPNCSDWIKGKAKNK